MHSFAPPAARAADPSPSARAAEQHGGAAVLELTAWCALLLVVANHVAALVVLAFSGVAPDLAAVGIVLAVGSWVALLPVLVVGWPLGVLTVWLLAREPREARHVAVFAVVGAVAAVLLGLVGVSGPPQPGPLVVLAVEGALGAGGGRWLLGHARRTRAARRTAAPLDPSAVAA